MVKNTKPTHVQIGAHIYKVLYSKESWKKYARYTTEAVGLCLVEECVILIAGWELSESQQKETLLHEILHACFAVTGFKNQPVELAENKHDIEEFMVMLLSPTMHLALRDNAQVFEWIAS